MHLVAHHVAGHHVEVVVEVVVEVIVVDGDEDSLVGLVVDAVEDGDVPAPLVEQRDD